LTLGNDSHKWQSIASFNTALPAAADLPDGTRTQFGAIISVNGVAQFTTGVANDNIVFYLCAVFTPTGACDPSTLTAFPWITTVTAGQPASTPTGQQFGFGMTEMVPGIFPGNTLYVTLYARVRGAAGVVWAVTTDPTLQLNAFIIQLASLPLTP